MKNLHKIILLMVCIFISSCAWLDDDLSEEAASNETATETNIVENNQSEPLKKEVETEIETKASNTEPGPSLTSPQTVNTSSSNHYGILIEEQSLQQSGLIKGEEESKSFETRTLDKTSIAKLGQMLGVEKLLLIYVVPSGRQLHMATIRLVDVETAKILSSTTVITPDTGQDVDIIMQQVAIDIVEVINNKETIVRNKLFTETQSSVTSSPNDLRKKGNNFLNKLKDNK